MFSFYFGSYYIFYNNLVPFFSLVGVIQTIKNIGKEYQENKTSGGKGNKQSIKNTKNKSFHHKIQIIITITKSI